MERKSNFADDSSCSKYYLEGFEPMHHENWGQGSRAAGYTGLYWATPAYSFFTIHTDKKEKLNPINRYTYA